MIDDAAGLLALVQMGGLEFHPWGTHQLHLDKPDRLIFDLDPDEGLDFGWVVVGALELRQRLLDIGLESFCKTSGGKGLHLVVPLRPRADWESAKAFCKAVAEAMAGDSPKRYVANMAKAKRTNKTFVDYLRNGRGATSVAAYSVRSRPGCPISTPLSWDEVDDKLDPHRFTVASWETREAKESNIWAGFQDQKQSLTLAVLKKV